MFEGSRVSRIEVFEGTGLFEGTKSLNIQPYVEVKKIGDDLGLHTNTSVNSKDPSPVKENLIE